MIQRLIYDPQVIQAVGEYAATHDVREDVAFEKARDYAREIVPGFSATAYFGFATRAARWLSRLVYKVEVAGEENIASLDPDATIVFVMNHRSNMDYVLVTYIAAQTSALAYAVGEWARVWPLRSLIRALGGYFLRRTARTTLYRKVLARYVQMATSGGVAQAAFLEGGLSLNGEIATPKMGLLSYIVAEFDPEGRDIIFIPVGLNYDRVLEDQILVSAAETGKRRFRGSVPEAAAFSLRYIWRRIRRRAHRMGYAGVSFGKPVSLRALSGEEGRIQPSALASDLMDRIGNAVPILPVPLVAHALTGQSEIERSALFEAVEKDRETASNNGRTMMVGENPLSAALVILERRGMVRSAGSKLVVDESRRSVLDFYAASVRELIDRPKDD